MAPPRKATPPAKTLKRDKILIDDIAERKDVGSYKPSRREQLLAELAALDKKERPAQSPRPLILFSGGLDSTFMLWRELSAGNDVDVLYAWGNQSPLKMDAEVEACNKIIAWLHANTEGRVIEQHRPNPVGTQTTQNDWGYYSDHRPRDDGHDQTLAWFLAAFYAVDSRIHDSVQIGYIMGDTSVGYLPQTIVAWNNLRICTARRNPVTLAFPLHEMTKEEVVRQIPKALLELTWTCELPVLKYKKPVACGGCVPCLRMAAVMSWHKNGSDVLSAGTTAAITYLTSEKAKAKAQAEKLVKAAAVKVTVKLPAPTKRKGAKR